MKSDFIYVVDQIVISTFYDFIVISTFYGNFF